MSAFDNAISGVRMVTRVPPSTPTRVARLASVWNASMNSGRQSG